MRISSFFWEGNNCHQDAPHSIHINHSLPPLASLFNYQTVSLSHFLFPHVKSVVLVFSSSFFIQGSKSDLQGLFLALPQPGGEAN